MSSDKPKPAEAKTTASRQRPAPILVPAQQPQRLLLPAPLFSSHPHALAPSGPTPLVAPVLPPAAVTVPPSATAPVPRATNAAALPPVATAAPAAKTPVVPPSVPAAVPAKTKNSNAVMYKPTASVPKTVATSFSITGSAKSSAQKPFRIPPSMLKQPPKKDYAPLYASPPPRRAPEVNKAVVAKKPESSSPISRGTMVKNPAPKVVTGTTAPAAESTTTTASTTTSVSVSKPSKPVAGPAKTAPVAPGSTQIAPKKDPPNRPLAPTRKDVLLPSTLSQHRHWPGNVMMNQWMLDKREDYSSCDSRREQSKILTSLLARLQEEGGRILTLEGTKQTAMGPPSPIWRLTHDSESLLFMAKTMLRHLSTNAKPPGIAPVHRHPVQYLQQQQQQQQVHPQQQLVHPQHHQQVQPQPQLVQHLQQQVQPLPPVPQQQQQQPAPPRRKPRKAVILAPRVPKKQPNRRPPLLIEEPPVETTQDLMALYSTPVFSQSFCRKRRRTGTGGDGTQTTSSATKSSTAKKSKKSTSAATSSRIGKPGTASGSKTYQARKQPTTKSPPMGTTATIIATTSQNRFDQPRPAQRVSTKTRGAQSNKKSTAGSKSTKPATTKPQTKASANSVAKNFAMARAASLVAAGQRSKKSPVQDRRNSNASTQSKVGVNSESYLPKGVTMRPSGKWQAQVYFSGASRYIGVFEQQGQAKVAFETFKEYMKPHKSTCSTYSKEKLLKVIDAGRRAASTAVSEVFGKTT